jgi:hypothetical protein
VFALLEHEVQQTVLQRAFRKAVDPHLLVCVEGVQGSFMWPPALPSLALL